MLSLLNDAKAMVDELKLAVADCEAMTDDIQALESWAQIFTDQTALVSLVTKNALKHPLTIKNDLALIKSDFETEHYYDAGKEAAELLQLLLGPVYPSKVDASMLEFDGWGIIPFVEGFLYTFLGDGNLPEIDACYAGTSDLMVYARAALADIESLNIFDALGEIEKFIFHFQLDFQPCTAMSDDMEAIKTWGEQFKDIPTLIKNVSEAYILHHRKISQDITDFKTAEAAKDYFTAGSDIADVAVLLLGAPSEPTFLQ
jgi:hypothetical protein